MLRQKISGVLSKLRQTRPPPEVPPAIAEHLPGRKARALKQQLEGELRQAKDREALLNACIAAAGQHDWPPDEIEKLRIYAAYFSGNNQYAYSHILANNFHLSDIDMFVVACISLYVSDQFEEAARLLDLRDVLSNDFAEHQDFLGFAGYIIAAAGRPFSDAIALFDAALDRGEIFKVLAINAYPMYFEAGHMEKADRLRRILHERYPHDPEALYALGCVEIAKDYYPEGFRLCEARYFHPEAARYLNSKLLEKPRWEGESIAGKRVLVHAEQGFGDNIMCARYLPELRHAGATVILECQEAATSLIAANFPEVEIIPTHQRRADTTPFDVWVGAMSLPHLFNNTAETIPYRSGYLNAPREHIDHWRSRLESFNLPRQPNIGLAWSGNRAHRNDRRRSISYELFSGYLASLQQTNLFALQTEVPQSDSALIDLSDELVTLADTAALIELMDLVITVDTSIVHLAGALGKETWLLLPYRYEWRWGLTGTTNAWYDSVRVIRQTANGHWTEVLDQVFHDDLPDYLTQHGKTTHVSH
jgi:hypothetical protein